MNSRDENCQRFSELLSAYRDDELDASEAGHVKEHLSSCSDCRNDLASIESVVKKLEQLPRKELGRDLSGDIAKRIAQVPPPSPAISKVVPMERRKPAFFLTAAAVIVALVGAGYLMVSRGGSAGGGVTMAERPQGGVEKRQLATNNPAVAVTVDTQMAAKPEPVLKPEKTASEQQTLLANKPARKALESEKPLAKRRSNSKAVINLEDLSANEAIVAFDGDENDVFDGSGITTDEDGLYAIKM